MQSIELAMQRVQPELRLERIGFEFQQDARDTFAEVGMGAAEPFESALKVSRGDEREAHASRSYWSISA